MSSAKFTLIGAYQFFHNANDDLFVNMDLPTGVNPEILQNNILFHGGEFEVQSANPFFIQTMIGNWSKVYYDTIDRWVKALAIEYAPLENYDRQEHWTDERDGSLNRNGSVRETGTLDATTTDHTETKKSAFDSSSYSGNIGVTTSQQMLQQELDIGYWNLYQRITDLFLREFTIPVYE